MRVVFIAPAYPAEMPEFTRGLAEVGARVIGVTDQPAGALPRSVRAHLQDHLQVRSLMNEDALVEDVVRAFRGNPPDRVECLWEPLVIAAARIREALGVPGMSADTVRGFRDKQLMKERVAAAGLRVPHSRRVRSPEETRAAAAFIGYPLILKPIAGAGSADTYRVESDKELEAALARMGHVTEASCEEFVEGREFTYDTICVNGQALYENVAQYLPRPLVARSNEWISPIICTVRDLHQPALRGGLELGRSVLQALGMGTGFTHMEWYLKDDGEVVFGEIGARVGGARLIDQMNYTSDIDLYREWARAVVHGRVEGPVHWDGRKYNCAIVFKRAEGQGRIRSVLGLDRFMLRHGKWVVADTLLRPGQHRRDWKATLVSDGYLIARHPDWGGAMHIAADAAQGVRLIAGG